MHFNVLGYEPIPRGIISIGMVAKEGPKVEVNPVTWPCSVVPSVPG